MGAVANTFAGQYGEHHFGRLTRGDVADAVALLCTDEAKWITGATFRVDGGEDVRI